MNDIAIIIPVKREHFPYLERALQWYARHQIPVYWEEEGLVYQAARKAVRRAREPYLALAGADDLWLPDALDYFRRLLERQPWLHAVGGRGLLFETDTRGPWGNVIITAPHVDQVFRLYRSSALLYSLDVACAHGGGHPEGSIAQLDFLESQCDTVWTDMFHILRQGGSGLERQQRQPTLRERLGRRFPRLRYMTEFLRTECAWLPGEPCANCCGRLPLIRHRYPDVLAFIREGHPVAPAR